MPTPAAARRRVVHSLTLQDRLRFHLTAVCGLIGADAIEARASWSAGKQLIVEQTAVGAAEGDVMRLARIPRPEPVR